MKIRDTKSSLEALKQKMNDSEKVFYVRFGDGDINIITGTNCGGENLKDEVSFVGSDKTIYCEKQSQDSRKSFCIEHPNYIRGLVGEYPIEPGMKPHVFKYSKKKLEFIDNSVKKLTNSRYFYNPITFHYYFYQRPEEFLSFVEQYINPHKILFVGNCKNPRRLFNINKQIYTPEKNSYLQKKRIWQEFKKEIPHHSLVIMAAGYLTRALAYQAWNLPYNFHYIDIGSLVDVLDGKATRGWIKYTNVMEWWQKRLNYE